MVARALRVVPWLRPCTRLRLVQVSDQGTTLRASDIHNARATILNPFSICHLLLVSLTTPTFAYCAKRLKATHKADTLRLKYLIPNYLLPALRITAAYHTGSILHKPIISFNAVLFAIYIYSTHGIISYNTLQYSFDSIPLFIFGFESKTWWCFA